jgi:hypothetical protein
MRLRLGLFALASLVVFLISAGVSSFVVDPENIGVRLALYALALLALIGIVLFTVFAIVFPLFGRTGVKRADVEAAVAAGRQAYARVTSARPTGGQLNGAWAYDVRLVVAATDIAPYSVSDRVRVHRTEGKLFGTGEIVTVARLGVDDPHVVVTNGPASTPQDRAVPQDAPAWPGA